MMQLRTEDSCVVSSHEVILVLLGVGLLVSQPFEPYKTLATLAEVTHC